MPKELARFLAAYDVKSVSLDEAGFFVSLPGRRLDVPGFMLSVDTELLSSVLPAETTGD